MPNGKSKIECKVCSKYFWVPKIYLVLYCVIVITKITSKSSPKGIFKYLHCLFYITYKLRNKTELKKIKNDKTLLFNRQVHVPIMLNYAKILMCLTKCL